MGTNQALKQCIYSHDLTYGQWTYAWDQDLFGKMAVFSSPHSLLALRELPPRPSLAWACPNGLDSMLFCCGDAQSDD